MKASQARWHQMMGVAALSSPLIVGLLLGAVGFCHDQPPSDDLFGWSLWLEEVRYRSNYLHSLRLQLPLASAVHFYSCVAGLVARRWNASKGATAEAPLAAFAALGLFIYSLGVAWYQPEAIEWGVKPVYFDDSVFVLTLGHLQRYLGLRFGGKTIPKGFYPIVGIMGVTSLITAWFWLFVVLEGDWFIADQALVRAISLAVVASPLTLAEAIGHFPSGGRARGPWRQRLLHPARAGWLYHIIVITLALRGDLSPPLAAAVALGWVAWRLLYPHWTGRGSLRVPNPKAEATPVF